MMIFAILLYMAYIIYLGFKCAKKNQNSNDFYLGGRKLGPYKVRDAETGAETYIDTSSQRTRREHHEWWVRNQVLLRNIFTKSNVDNISIRTDEDFVKALMMLFRRRA